MTDPLIAITRDTRDTLDTPSLAEPPQPPSLASLALASTIEANTRLDFLVERQMAASRPRLLRLARLQGVTSDAAEDIVQETLLEAWRVLGALRDPRRVDSWLDGICRNVCRRWLRRHAALVARQQSLTEWHHRDTEDDDEALDLPDPLAFDPAEALTRQELARLLDRALAHLPAGAREPLVLRYISGLPIAEIALRLGLSTGAAEVRLHRARRDLRQVLRGRLRAEAEAFDLSLDVVGADGTGTDRAPTRIWCPLCGARHLEAEITWTTGDVHYWCSTCGHLAGSEGPALVAGVRGYKPILSRVLVFLTNLYTRGLATGEAPCCSCGQIAGAGPLAPDAPSQVIEETGGMAVHIHCHACGADSGADIRRLSVDRIETQRFWRAHPRIRTLPPRELEVQGIAAVAVSVESVTESARLDIIWARETLQVLRVHGTPGAR